MGWGAELGNEARPGFGCGGQERRDPLLRRQNPATAIRRFGRLCRPRARKDRSARGVRARGCRPRQLPPPLISSPLSGLAAEPHIGLPNIPFASPGRAARAARLQWPGAAPALAGVCSDPCRASWARPEFGAGSALLNWAPAPHRLGFGAFRLRLRRAGPGPNRGALPDGACPARRHLRKMLKMTMDRASLSALSPKTRSYSRGGAPTDFRIPRVATGSVEEMSEAKSIACGRQARGCARGKREG